MFYWILFILSGVGLIWIFRRRLKATLQSFKFAAEMEKEAQHSTESTGEIPIEAMEMPTDLQLKRQAEQRSREEKNRKIRESKKAFKQAEVYFTKGDYGIAEKHLLQVLSFDNDHLDANLKLGLLYLHQENLPRAEFFFQKLLDLKEHPVYYSNLAMTLYQQDRLEEAAKYYEKAITLDNKRPQRYVSLAHVYQKLGESEKALKHFEEASRLDPRNLDYLWILLDYYEKLVRQEALAGILKRILGLDPYNADVQRKLADLKPETSTE